MLNVAQAVVRVPSELLNTARYAYPSSLCVTDFTVYVPAVAAGMFVQVRAESVERCHCTDGVGEPVAAAAKLTFAPALTSADCGCCVTAGSPSQGSTPPAAC